MRLRSLIGGFPGVGWRRYLASDRKNGLNFCLLLQGGGHLGLTNEYWSQ